jgi:predicted TIM-barrel fold metal-dependent hydrolase
MKIDIYSHILPEKYRAGLIKENSALAGGKEMLNRANCDLAMRLRVMGRFPDVLQVLTLSLPPVEAVVPARKATKLAKLANDELAEIVAHNPDKFIAAVACLPLNDMEAALEETDRSINKLGLKGVQIFARINGEQLDNRRYWPLYEKMARLDLPIWIHPVSDEIIDESLFGWPFATSLAMLRLVNAGIFTDFPNLKFITHHCGALLPYFEGRIKWLHALQFGKSHQIRNSLEHFRKFYTDTATYGSTSALTCGYDFFGAERLLFGTDAPLGPPSGLTFETIQSVERMNIPEAEKEEIFCRNAMGLLKLAL